MTKLIPYDLTNCTNPPFARISLAFDSHDDFYLPVCYADERKLYVQLDLQLGLASFYMGSWQNDLGALGVGAPMTYYPR